jgi:hypothetical protein
MTISTTLEERTEARSALSERLKPRIAVEEHFAQLGHIRRWLFFGSGALQLPA